MPLWIQPVTDLKRIRRFEQAGKNFMTYRMCRMRQERQTMQWLRRLFQRDVDPQVQVNEATEAFKRSLGADFVCTAVYGSLASNEYIA